MSDSPAPFNLLPSLVASPSVRRLAGMPSTPDNNGLVVDRNNTLASATQTTAALSAWGTACIANGDAGYLSGGQYPTNAEVLWSGASGKSAAIEGAGPQSTVIRPAANTYNGLRINIGNALQSKGRIGGFGVIGPSRPTSIAFDGVGVPASNGKSAICLDATTLLAVCDTEVGGYDIGYDFINNCYNASLYNPSEYRFGATNVGIYLREGSQSGSDINIYNANLSGYIHAVCMKGGGGGYRFYGGQWQNQFLVGQTVLTGSGAPASGTGANGNYYIDLAADLFYGPKAGGAWPGTGRAVPGVIQLGWDYLAQSEFDGLSSAHIMGIGMEGWQNSHAIRAYGQNRAVFRDMHFTATQSGNGAALDIIRATDVKAATYMFDGCELSGTFINTFLAYATGQYSPFPFDEGMWFSPGFTLAGGATITQLPSMAYQAGLPGHGKFMYPDITTIIGRMFLRSNGTALQYSNNGGTTWTNVGS